MITKYVVSWVLCYLQRKGVISTEKNEMELYKYGVEISLSSIISFLEILFIGIATSHFIESILFLVVFIFIRSFTGGFHANTYLKCNLVMLISFIAIVIIYELLRGHINWIYYLMVCGFSVLVVSAFSPIENIYKPINVDDKFKFKIIGILLTGIFSMIGVLLTNHNIYFGNFIILTVCLVAIFIIVSKVLGRGD